MGDKLVSNETEMVALGSQLSRVLKVGQVVLFEGQLGAGKTTLIRGILRGLGWDKLVRSPTYGLFIPYETVPPVLHADLYRVADARGTGIEDYLDSHLCLIEWPAALDPLVNLNECPVIRISIEGDARRVSLSNIL